MVCPKLNLEYEFQSGERVIKKFEIKIKKGNEKLSSLNRIFNKHFWFATTKVGSIFHTRKEIGINRFKNRQFFIKICITIQFSNSFFLHFSKKSSASDNFAIFLHERIFRRTCVLILQKKIERGRVREDAPSITYTIRNKPMIESCFLKIVLFLLLVRETSLRLFETIEIKW